MKAISFPSGVLTVLALIPWSAKAATIALAAPPGPGQRFDCSQGGSGVSCASDDTGCVPQTKDDPSGGTVSTLKCSFPCQVIARITIPLSSLTAHMESFIDERSVVPGGLGQIAVSLRDRLLRMVANRRGILVPSLVADKRVEEGEDKPSDEVDLLRGALAGAPGA